MRATLYKPLSESAPTWAEAKITDIFKIISYNYTKKFYEVGSFSMVIPVNEPSAELLETNTFLATSDGDYLFVTDIKETESRITLEGYDLKYLLAGRITLFPTEEQDKGTYGYYVTQGSTGKCICDIVRHNITEASDPNRRIYGFSVNDSPHGLPNDTYMTRLEPLDQVVGTLCKNAGIGYDVTMEIGSAFGDSIKFTVIKPTDRSADQTDVPKMIFSKGFLNVENLSRETGVASEKNAIYAINGSNIDDAVVKLVNRNGEGKADHGVYRRETTVNVNCDIDEIDSYALKEAEDFITTDSFVMEVMAAESYKKEWFVGDIVTFRHKEISRNVPIIAAEVRRTADKFTVRLSAGETVTRPVSMINRTANKAVNEITQKKFDDGYVTVVEELPEVGKKNKIYVLEEDRAAVLANDPGAIEAGSETDTISGFVFVEGQWKKIGGEGGGAVSSGVGEFTNEAKNSEIFNSYEDVTNDSGAVSVKKNYINPKTGFAHVSGMSSSIDEDEDITSFSSAAAILGGNFNKILSSFFSAILCGQNNKITASQFAAILSGMGNIIQNAAMACIAGGNGNSCAGAISFIGGGMNNKIISALYSAICGGNGNSISATGMARAFIGGGDGNKITGGFDAAIVGGSNNTTATTGSGILSGNNNSIDGNGYCSAVVCGTQNHVQGPYSAILCGSGNTVKNGNSAIIAGNENLIEATHSVVAGTGNKITGNGLCCFVFGDDNSLNGSHCFVCGVGAKANPTHAFVIGNSGSGNSDPNIFYVDRLGNVYAKSFNIIGETTSEISTFSARSADTPDLSELSEQLTKIKADIEALKEENAALKAEIELLKAR